MLSKMIIEKMKEEDLSLRTAGMEIGVSHATLKRAIDGESLDLDTVRLISDWLGIPLSDALDLESGNVEELPRKLSVFISQYPELEEVLEKALSSYEKGDIEAAIVKDIVSYISFRLEQASKND